jgi:AbrB family looped-hinge helix DNA binding protein
MKTPKQPAVRYIARLGARSRVVIPKRVRERLCVGPGDLVEFVVRADAVLVRAVRTGTEPDPFAVFTEWAGKTDERAFGDL